MKYAEQIERVAIKVKGSRRRKQGRDDAASFPPLFPGWRRRVRVAVNERKNRSMKELKGGKMTKDQGRIAGFPPAWIKRTGAQSDPSFQLPSGRAPLMHDCQSINQSTPMNNKRGASRSARTKKGGGEESPRSPVEAAVLARTLVWIQSLLPAGFAPTLAAVSASHSLPSSVDRRRRRWLLALLLPPRCSSTPSPGPHVTATI